MQLCADSITAVIDVLGVVNDRAGNVVCDDLYFYQYDAWNRLIQVRHRGTLEFDADGNAAGGTPGEWIVHYTYDALGRLVRKQLPHNVELEQVRIEEYYYDGVRRISETLTTPLFSSGGGPVGGGGGGGGSGETQTVTDREYVWAPPRITPHATRESLTDIGGVASSGCARSVGARIDVGLLRPCRGLQLFGSPPIIV